MTKKKRNMHCYTVKVYQLTSSGKRLDHGKTIISSLTKKQALECACTHATSLFVQYCSIRSQHTYEVEILNSKGEIYTSYQIVTDQQGFSAHAGGEKRGITEGESLTEMQAIREAYWSMQIKIAELKRNL